MTDIPPGQVIFSKKVMNDWNIKVATCPDGDTDHVHVTATDGLGNDYEDFSYTIYADEGPADIITGIYHELCRRRIVESMQHKILTLTAGVHIDN